MDRPTDAGSGWYAPRTIAASYVVFGVVWILVSDWLVNLSFERSALTAQAQLAKGLLFVGGSAAFVYWLIQRRARVLERSEARIRDGRARIDDLRSEVRESEQLLSVILDNINETVLLTDDAGRFTYVCPNVRFIFGYDREAVREMGRVEALLGGRVRPEGFGPEDVVENVEREVVDAEGRTHTVLVTVKSVAIESGSVLYSVRDITERKTQEERFRAYVENSSDVLTVLDEAMRVEYVSPSVERILGHDPSDVVGRDAIELVHPDDRAHVREQFDELADRPPGTTGSSRYRTRRADGTWAWTESRVTTHDSDTLGAYVVNTRDVSDLKEREGRLSVLDRVLRHNIRNKLNIVVGAAEEMDRAVDGDTPAELDLIVDAADDLLQLSEKARRFDASIRRWDGAAEPTDLVGLVRTVVAEKRREYPDAEIDVDLPESAWASAHELLELALAELVDNAVVHAGTVSPSVEIDVECEAETVNLTVTDDGPGLPEMDRAVVLRGGETPLEHGLHLGLWLVRWTVDNSDGTLAVSENQPRGTRIEVRLPAAAPAADRSG